MDAVVVLVAVAVEVAEEIAVLIVLLFGAKLRSWHSMVTRGRCLRIKTHWS